MDNGIHTLREQLEELSTQELDVLLNRELEQKAPDGALIKAIMEILWDREKDLPLEITPKIRTAWERYRKNIENLDRQDRARRKRGTWLRFASVAAVLCLVILAVPRQAEAESFFEKLARWSGSILEFFGPETKNDNRLDYVFISEDPGLRQVYEAVTALGVTDPVVPMWIPEGYELVECKTVETSQKSGVLVSFQNAEQSILYKVDIYAEDVSHKYHKDESTLTTYDYGGISHKILRNNDRWVVVWFRDTIECFLTLDCSEDVLYEILRSVYVTEDTNEETN